MKKPVLLAALSAFVLIGAAYPAAPKLDYVIDLDGGGTAARPATQWRPCRDRRDDRCIQLYERGVRASYAQWRHAHGETRLAAARPRPHRRHAELALAARCAEPATAARRPARAGEGAAINGM